jgi:glutathione S-transferase
VKFFYSPNACSIGIHVLLEEIGKPYERAWVNFAEGAQYKPAYVAINPKSKVPAIERDDGAILTEFPAIAYYLARTNPDSGLLPDSLDGEIRGLELLEYMTATIHMRGFTRMFRSGTFTPNAADEPKVVEAGRGFITKGFDILAPVLGDKPYLLGDRLTFPDAGLFFLTYWAKFRAEIPMPANLDAYISRMLERPAVQRVLAAEGLK